MLAQIIKYEIMSCSGINGFMHCEIHCIVRYILRFTVKATCKILILHSITV